VLGVVQEQEGAFSRSRKPANRPASIVEPSFVILVAMKRMSSAERSARVVRSKMSRAKKMATVKSATKKVKTSAKVDFVRSVRG